ncbi:MAG: biotin synthase BioB [Gammaproteobacteria bacterium]|nr:biotin synthase BioB [Gammaproteobacteria bacterium]
MSIVENDVETQSSVQKQAKSLWSFPRVEKIYSQPFNDLIFSAHRIYRDNFNPNEIQLSTLLNIKSGGCPEDCAYCPQSAHYETHAEITPLMDVDEVVAAAKAAKQNGSQRFCMGAAWRSPRDKDISKLQSIISSVKAEGLETCATLGMLTDEQAEALKASGLDYYNHNIDTSPEYYEEIIQTRTFEDRIETLRSVRHAGIKVCCGGIVGMGESKEDRINFLLALSNMSPPPESVPINRLVRAEGTPLKDQDSLDWIDLVRTIATARILMPDSYLRLSAGRNDMSEELQALSFFAGANSIFYGEKLLTTENPQAQEDERLLARLGITPKK